MPLDLSQPSKKVPKNTCRRCSRDGGDMRIILAAQRKKPGNTQRFVQLQSIGTQLCETCAVQVYDAVETLFLKEAGLR